MLMGLAALLTSAFAAWEFRRAGRPEAAGIGRAGPRQAQRIITAAARLFYGFVFLLGVALAAALLFRIEVRFWL